MPLKKFLSHILESWKRIARKIGDFQARLILTFFYLFILGPFALAVRWGGDPLRIKTGKDGGWIAKIDREGAPMKRATEQF